ncbi:patched domain-containing protein 3-like [Acinonyx jubatus]|uniref:Patched domain-containing protein 3-like n=1 Tax=Acinonyx jubatus TaxID=32536 RepID=A0ABM3NSQ0_ACIJB|nr:patched domain-containing protein 3-like [Acinonyx jubatus]
MEEDQGAHKGLGRKERFLSVEDVHSTEQAAGGKLGHRPCAGHPAVRGVTITSPAVARSRTPQASTSIVHARQAESRPGHGRREVWRESGSRLAVGWGIVGVAGFPGRWPAAVSEGVARRRRARGRWGAAGSPSPPAAPGREWARWARLAGGRARGGAGSRDSYCFSISRKSTEVNFACILAVSNTTSLLEPAILSEDSKVDDVIQDLYATGENGTQIHYNQVCAKHQGLCLPSNPLLYAWQMNRDLDLRNVTFPIYNHTCQPIYLAGTIGGTFLGERMGMNQLLLEAKALRLVYYLKTEDGEDNERGGLLYINFYTTELEATLMTVIPLFHLAYLLIILFAILSCYR